MLNEKVSSNDLYEEHFTKPIIKVGMLTLLGAIPLTFLPAIYLYMRYGAIPPAKVIFTGWFLVASIYGCWYFVEPISYHPIVGSAGTYMFTLSGNITNMRIPCAAVAQEVCEVEPGSNEAEIVGTLGMAGSIITNLIVVTLAAIAGNEIFKVFPPIVIQAFDYVLPSIFGALFAMSAINYPKYAVLALSLALILLGIVKVLPAWIVIPVCVFGTVGYAIKTYNKTKNDSKV